MRHRWEGSVSKLLLIGYILSVLLFSGFSRAEDLRDPSTASQLVPVKIDKAEFSKETYLLRLSGKRGTPCISLPTPVLVANQEKVNSFRLVAQSVSENSLCIQVLSPYQLVFDLRSLFQNTQFIADQPVTIEIDGTKDILEVPGNALSSAFPLYNATYFGTLTMEGSNLFLLEVSGKKIALMSVGIDTKAFLNQRVEVHGIMFSHNILAANSSVPLVDSIDSKAQLLIVGISTIR